MRKMSEMTYVDSTIICQSHKRYGNIDLHHFSQPPCRDVSRVVIAQIVIAHDANIFPDLSSRQHPQSGTAKAARPKRHGASRPVPENQSGTAQAVR